MRLLHTADWHLGRTLEGRSRHQEQVDVLEEMVRLAEEERVDVVLMAGDVFDTYNPPAESEALFYETMRKLTSDGKRQVVVIAGNHDSPARIEAALPLAKSHGIHLIGAQHREPLKLDVPTTGEKLVISALPYPSEARLNESLSDYNDETLIQQGYHEKIKQLFADHADVFSSNTVNIVMSHLFLAGGSETDSERPIQVGGAYTVYPEAFPSNAQYVALGHLHRPQTSKASQNPIRYSGSPLAYSFSEANQVKSVTVVDVEPGAEATLTTKHLSSGRSLVRWRAKGGMAEVWQWVTEGRDEDAWIDLEVYVDNVLSLKEIQEIRRERPGLIHIRPIFPEQNSRVETGKRMTDLPLDEVFTRFYKKQTGGAEPADKTMELFLDLLKETEEGDEIETNSAKPDRASQFS